MCSNPIRNQNFSFFFFLVLFCFVFFFFFWLRTHNISAHEHYLYPCFQPKTKGGFTSKGWLAKSQELPPPWIVTNRGRNSEGWKLWVPMRTWRGVSLCVCDGGRRARELVAEKCRKSKQHVRGSRDSVGVGVERVYCVYVVCFLFFTWGWTLLVCFLTPSCEGEEACNGNRVDFLVCGA